MDCNESQSNRVDLQSLLHAVVATWERKKFKYKLRSTEIQSHLFPFKKRMTNLSNNLQFDMQKYPSLM